jgi:hypothetical protein
MAIRQTFVHAARPQRLPSAPSSRSLSQIAEDDISALCGLRTSQKLPAAEQNYAMTDSIIAALSLSIIAAL